ncbi:MAG TPA: hypothetical protein VIU38_12865, partial [Anaerolineales bacterium]
WTIEGAEAVIGEAEAIDGLLGLVNKSLVNVTERLGASRYDFLQTIRQYAMEKLLESNEAGETHARHVEHVLEIVTEIAPDTSGAPRFAWFDHMEVEHDNLRAALEWSAAHSPPQAVQLGVVLGDFWLARDYYTEAQAWCQTILAGSEGLTDLASARANLYAVLAQAAIYMGDHKSAYPATVSGAALAEQAGDNAAQMRLYALMGLSCMYLGDFAASMAALDRGEALARQTASARDLAMMLIFRIQANYFAGSIEQMQAYAAEAEALTMVEAWHWSNTTLDFAFARLSGLLGNVERARVLFKRTAEAAEESGNVRLVISCQSELAHILRRRGDEDEALRLYAEVLPRWRDLGHRSALAHELECIAFILSHKEQPEHAVTLLGAAEVLRAAAKAAMTKPEQAEYDQVLSVLHTGVEQNRFKELWDAGRALDVDHAVEYALEAAGKTP